MLGTIHILDFQLFGMGTPSLSLRFGQTGLNYYFLAYDIIMLKIPTKESVELTFTKRIVLLSTARKNQNKK